MQRLLAGLVGGERKGGSAADRSQAVRSSGESGSNGSSGVRLGAKRGDEETGADGHVVMGGYLRKVARASHMFASLPGKWHRRYFAIVAGDLCYKHRKSSDSWKLRLPLAQVTNVDIVRPVRRGVHAFEVKSPMRDFVLRAKTVRDAERWLRALKLHVDLWRRKAARDVARLGGLGSGWRDEQRSRGASATSGVTRLGWRQADSGTSVDSRRSGATLPTPVLARVGTHLDVIGLSRASSYHSSCASTVSSRGGDAAAVVPVATLAFESGSAAHDQHAACQDDGPRVGDLSKPVAVAVFTASSSELSADLATATAEGSSTCPPFGVSRDGSASPPPGVSCDGSASPPPGVSRDGSASPPPDASRDGSAGMSVPTAVVPETPPDSVTPAAVSCAHDETEVHAYSTALPRAHLHTTLQLDTSASEDALALSSDASPAASTRPTRQADRAPEESVDALLAEVLGGELAPTRGTPDGTKPAQQHMDRHGGQTSQARTLRRATRFDGNARQWQQLRTPYVDTQWSQAMPAASYTWHSSSDTLSSGASSPEQSGRVSASPRGVTGPAITTTLSPKRPPARQFCRSRPFMSPTSPSRHRTPPSPRRHRVVPTSGSLLSATSSLRRVPHPPICTPADTPSTSPPVLTTNPPSPASSTHTPPAACATSVAVTPATAAGDRFVATPPRHPRQSCVARAGADPAAAGCTAPLFGDPARRHQSPSPRTRARRLRAVV